MGGLECSREALEIAERAIELDSDRSFALQQRNRALSGLGCSQEALETAERLVEPDSAKFFLQIDSKREAKRKVLFDRAAFPNQTRSPGMRTYVYPYPVKLREEQRRFLETMVHTSRTPAKHYLVARVLLMSDQQQGQPEATDSQIAEVLSISRRTVIRIKQRFVREHRIWPHPAMNAGCKRSKSSWNSVNEEWYVRLSRYLLEQSGVRKYILAVANV